MTINIYGRAGKKKYIVHAIFQVQQFLHSWNRYQMSTSGGAEPSAYHHTTRYCLNQPRTLQVHQHQPRHQCPTHACTEDLSGRVLFTTTTLRSSALINAAAVTIFCVDQQRRHDFLRSSMLPRSALINNAGTIFCVDQQRRCHDLLR